MAKKKHIESQQDVSKRIQRTENYANKVRQLFAQTVNDILAINKDMPKLDDGVMFSFDGESKRKQTQVEELLRKLHSVATMAIQQGISVEWDIANKECDELVRSCFGKKVLESPEFSAWTQRNTAARDAFINRTDNGMNLSKRIWQSVEQLRDEMEVAMTVAIGEGDSAASISRKVRQYLNDPDLMFRRFRYKIGEDDNGQPVYGKKWKKRIKDSTGKYKWIDYDRDSYKTGAGVYKSSAKNAMRVARTETNIAYRRADHERWQQMDFVLGQKIQLSRKHPHADICDDLAGDYPKDFVFDGWHPQCFCFSTPILISENEMEKVTERFLQGETYTPRGKQIDDYPTNFKSWVKDHEEDIAYARSRGKEPYFIKNNAMAIDDILHPKQKELTILDRAKLRHDARTPEQEEAIRNAWAERQQRYNLITKTAKNVLDVAQDYGEVDFAELQDAIGSGNIKKMHELSKTVAKHVSAMKKQELAISDIIPDAHEWHKQFSMKELIETYTAVETKLASLKGKSLDEQKKILAKEMKYVSDPSYLKPHKLYPTWNVAQAAYVKEYANVIDAIDWELINQELKEAVLYKTKSKPYLSLVDELNEAISSKNKFKAQTIVANIQAKRDALKRASEARARKKQSGIDGTIIFSEDCFTEQRRAKANFSLNKRDAEDYFFDNAVETYRVATKDMKKAAESYTFASGSITKMLRGADGYSENSLYYAQKSTKEIGYLTDMIKGKTFAGDTWVVRDERLAFTVMKAGGYDISSLEYNMREFERKIKQKYKTKYGDNLTLEQEKKRDELIESYCQRQERKLIGLHGVDKSFLSCSSNKKSVFTGTGGDNKYGMPKTRLEIYCPEGTQGIYAAPFNHYNLKKTGSDGYWDGKSNTISISEAEVILQRGGEYRIIEAKYNKVEDRWYIKCELISQVLTEIDGYESIGYEYKIKFK